MKKFWINTTFAALLLASGGVMAAETGVEAEETTAATEAPAPEADALQEMKEEARESLAQREDEFTEAIELLDTLQQWQEAFLEAIGKSTDVADEIYDTVRQEMKEVKTGELTSDEADRRRQQIHAPALRANEAENLEPMIAQTDAVFDALVVRLQALFAQKQCKDADLTKACQSLESGIRVLTSAKPEVLRMTQLLKQVMGLAFEAAYLDPEDSTDLGRLLEIGLEMDALSGELDKIRLKLQLLRLLERKSR
ncbi:MAG: hypothetical protein LBJ59_04760 [Zoogloeaceae bacterium]|jgi:O6-methylguanine-DNA--protein-cysteine methyltransferase|nr:hypothetical protein [Zoogloeaceae bacterium]